MIIFSSLPIFVYAQTSDIRNFIALSASGGYTNTLTNDPLVKPFGFMGGTVDFGYEMLKGENFWWSVMGEAQCMTSVLAINHEECGLLGAEYNVNKWEDYPHCFFLSLPVMLGYRKNAFYFGVGPKVSFFSYGRSLSKMSFSMADNPSRDYAVRQSANLKTSLFNVALGFEIGGVVYDPVHNMLGSRGWVTTPYNQNIVVKVGLYAEYWLLNMNPYEGYRQVVTISPDKPHAPNILPPFLSTSMQNRIVNPLYVGVRISILFDPEDNNCHCLPRSRR